MQSRLVYRKMWRRKARKTWTYNARELNVRNDDCRTSKQRGRYRCGWPSDARRSLQPAPRSNQQAPAPLGGASATEPTLSHKSARLPRKIRFLCGRRRCSNWRGSLAWQGQLHTKAGNMMIWSAVANSGNALLVYCTCAPIPYQKIGKNSDLRKPRFCIL